MRPLPALALALIGRGVFSVVSLVTRGRLNSAVPLPPVPGAPGAGSATVFLGPTGAGSVPLGPTGSAEVR